MELYHNSRDEACRLPIGAVPCGTEIRLRMYADANTAQVYLRLWSGESTFHPMKRLAANAFELNITAPATPLLWWYDFMVIDCNGNTVHYGNAHDKLGGEGVVYKDCPPSFQITVYDPAFMPPDYLRNGIMYQIFPDRFHRTALPKSTRTDVTLHTEWNELPLVDPDPRSGDNRALDFFGGSLKGIEEKLPYLKELGVTVLYLNPIFKARSNHRYDTGDYQTIDPILGTKEDFISLCAAAKKIGIRLLLDGVFSHTGEDSVYFNRYNQYSNPGAYQGKKSPYYGWYTFTHFPNQYACWWGIPTLPEINKNNPDYRHFIMNENGVARSWLKAGASGWRLDVADELPVSFLQELRIAVKQEKEDGVLLGEVWEDASNKIAYGCLRSYCLGDTVDSVMNYPLRDAVIRFLTGAIPADRVVRLIRSQQENYPVPFYYSLMNLMGSHDRARILNVLCEHEYNSLAHADRGKVKLSVESRTIAKARFEKMLSIFAALPGMPALYYGDEIGMEGAADPFCRAPFAWENMDPELHRQVQAAFALRHSRPVLKTGYMDISCEGTDTLVITRYLKDGKDAFGEKADDIPYILRITRDRYKKQPNK